MKESLAEIPSFQLNRDVDITVLVDNRFITRDESNSSFGGYLVEMVDHVARLANFTYTLKIASGYGKDCVPRLSASSSSSSATADAVHYAAHDVYSTQPNCAVNDVVELKRSDLYLGMFYLTPERQESNYFTIPFQPPALGTLTLFGTATHASSFEDYIEQQQQNKQPPVCILGSTAMLTFLQSTYPTLQARPFVASISAIHEYMDNGTCAVLAAPTPIALSFIQARYTQGRCHAKHNNLPIGIIAHMEFGLNHYAIGVGRHVGHDTAHALSYWINRLMIDGTLADLYPGGGPGDNECGYVAFPKSHLLPPGATAGVVVGATAIVTGLVLFLWYSYELRQQEKRYKKRFVQQIARNIAIGPRPGSIPPKKLTEQIMHIGNGKDVINRDDLLRWLSDIKMDFLSEEDFNALWNAIDIQNTGYVNAVEFIVFLSACGPEFERVYNEQESMPKMERLKLAARRLSHIAELGERGVRQREHQLERQARRGAFADATGSSEFSSGSHW